MQIASAPMVNIFCVIVFGLCIAIAFWMGCRPKDYWKLLTDPALVTNFSSTYGNATFLMNVGVFGLFILGYYNLIGANFNGNLIHKHEIIAEVIKRFNIEDTITAIMIGDREQDVSGAKMFYLESIGVRYGFAEENELEDAGADYIAETPNDILKIILE